jgi:hypothetical protein
MESSGMDSNGADAEASHSSAASARIVREPGLESGGGGTVGVAVKAAVVGVDSSRR